MGNDSCFMSIDIEHDWCLFEPRCSHIKLEAQRSCKAWRLSTRADSTRAYWFGGDLGIAQTDHCKGQIALSFARDAWNVGSRLNKGSS